MAAPKNVDKIARGLRIVCGVLAGIALVTLTFALSLDAVLRYLLGSPHPALPSISSDALLPMIAVVPMGVAAFEGDHVRMGFLYDRFPTQMRGLIDRFGHLIAFGIWAFIAWATGERALSRARSGVTSLTGSEVPEHLTLAVVALGAGLMALASLSLLIFGSTSLEEPDEAQSI